MPEHDGRAWGQVDDDIFPSGGVCRASVGLSACGELDAFGVTSIMGGAIRPRACACLIRRARSSAGSSMASYGDPVCSWRKESRHRSGLRFLRYQTAAAVSGGMCARYRMVFWPCRVSDVVVTDGAAVETALDPVVCFCLP